MIDPELKYCPKCQAEFHAEIVECAICNVDLLTGAELLARQRAVEERLAARKGELTEADELVSVRRGALEDMRHFEQLLKAEGIATLLAGDEQGCGKGCCPSTFDLVVRQEEAMEASQMIEAEIRRTAVIEGKIEDHHDAVFHDEASETTCPACGHTFKPAPECPECGLCF